ncbi:AraC family transcriptional regulator [Pandoraea sp. PE-S2R-1]|uniref:helix-turn-helix transcriptional regulator n=1 Tax=Pandoraea sp. PE-S2R-1 TaxID=1986994 RepID=UPI000B3FD4EB|nr:AraC family transcriptional regulator [Pandoraea sp. PE-S2R-1]
MLSGKLKLWFRQFQKYYFTYSKGFYHFPYSGKAPDKLVDSFKGLPFVTHSVSQQYLLTATPLMEGQLHYRELEDGFWLIYSKMRYKANVAFDLIHDDAENNDYYMLSLNNISNVVRTYRKFHEGEVLFPKYSWTFFKPFVRNCSVNFKGDDSRFITLFFNERWLQKNLIPSELFAEASLDQFIESDADYLLWPLAEREVPLEHFALFDQLTQIGVETQRPDLLKIKLSVLNLIIDFLRLCKAQDVVGNHLPVDHADRFTTHRVANYLDNHLLEKFPGLDFLAEKFEISKTRLKDEFRNQFGAPVYQYFQAQQMMLARTLLADKQLLVKELSSRLGYDNPSKFSAAFKKHHGILPSEL